MLAAERARPLQRCEGTRKARRRVELAKAKGAARKKKGHVRDLFKR